MSNTQKQPQENLPPSTAPASKGKLIQMVSPKLLSPLPSVGSKDFARAWRRSSTYLQGVLPANCQDLYTPRKYGRYIGIPIVCPHCEDRPPKHITPHSRWRWLSFHIATRHALKRMESAKQ